MWSFLMAAAAGCTTLVEVDLPDVQPQGVMEGTVRLGEPPLILLTTTQGYFDSTSVSSLPDMFVDNAEVVIRVNGEAFEVAPLCLCDLPPFLLDAAAEELGVDAEDASFLDISVYWGWEDEALYGAVGNVYEVEAHWEGEDGQQFDLTAEATMHAPPQLDSIWFEIPSTSTNDSLGLIWTSFTDPPGIGNAYRWASRRTNVGYGEKDFRYALGSAFDDAFLDGQTFPFANFRAPTPGVEEEPGGEGFWQVGDSVEVRLESLDHHVFAAIRDFETSVANQGNPFALPSSATSTVEGGLGWFVAYSGSFASTVCVN